MAPTAPYYIPKPKASRAPISSCSPQLPISFEKAQRIVSWRTEVHHCCPTPCGSAASSSSASAKQLAPPPPVEGSTEEDASHSGFMRLYHEMLDDEFDMDRWTFVEEGDRRVNRLPHPNSNALMTTEKGLIEEEYLRVLAEWNRFEEERWIAHRVFTKLPTSDNLQRFAEIDGAVQAAGAAARYIEAHATRYRIPINFQRHFFRTYRSPRFCPDYDEEWDWGFRAPGFDGGLPQHHHQPQQLQMPAPQQCMGRQANWQMNLPPIHQQLLQV